MWSSKLPLVALLPLLLLDERHSPSMMGRGAVERLVLRIRAILCAGHCAGGSGAMHDVELVAEVADRAHPLATAR